MTRSITQALIALQEAIAEAAPRSIRRGEVALVMGIDLAEPVKAALHREMMAMGPVSGGRTEAHNAMVREVMVGVIRVENSSEYAFRFVRAAAAHEREKLREVSLVGAGSGDGTLMEALELGSEGEA